MAGGGAGASDDVRGGASALANLGIGQGESIWSAERSNQLEALLASLEHAGSVLVEASALAATYVASGGERDSSTLSSRILAARLHEIREQMAEAVAGTHEQVGEDAGLQAKRDVPRERV